MCWFISHIMQLHYHSSFLDESIIWVNLILLVRIHPNLRSTVYCSALAAGDEDEWEFGWSQFKNTTKANEASKLMSALACTTKTQLLKR